MASNAALPMHDIWKQVEESEPKKCLLIFPMPSYQLLLTLQTLLTTAVSGAKYLQTSFQVIGKKTEGQSASSVMNEAHVTQRK